MLLREKNKIEKKNKIGVKMRNEQRKEIQSQENKMKFNEKSKILFRPLFLLNWHFHLLSPYNVQYLYMPDKTLYTHISGGLYTHLHSSVIIGEKKIFKYTPHKLNLPPRAPRRLLSFSVNIVVKINQPLKQWCRKWKRLVYICLMLFRSNTLPKLS